jgi:hypothetical protein
MKNSGSTLQDAADSIIGYLGAIGVAGLIVWGAAEMGVEQGRKQAYREFECKGAAYMTVWVREQKVNCIPYWGKTL